MSIPPKGRSALKTEQANAFLDEIGVKEEDVSKLSMMIDRWTGLPVYIHQTHPLFAKISKKILSIIDSWKTHKV